MKRVIEIVVAAGLVNVIMLAGSEAQAADTDALAEEMLAELVYACTGIPYRYTLATLRGEPADLYVELLRDRGQTEESFREAAPVLGVDPDSLKAEVESESIMASRLLHAQAEEYLPEIAGLLDMAFESGLYEHEGAAFNGVKARLVKTGCPRYGGE